MPAAPVVPTARQAPPALQQAAAFAFLLLLLTVPTSIAPMGIATALCALLTIAIWAWQRGGWVRSPVDPALLGWLAALVIVSLFAQDQAASFTRVKKGLLPLLVGLAAYHTALRTRGSRAVAVLLAGSAAVAAYAVAAWVGKGASMASRATGLAGHYMTYGGQLLLWLSLAAGIVVATRDRRWRLAAGAAFAVGAVALAATFTRSAWIGLVVSLGLMLALKRARWLLALAAVVAVAVVLAPPTWHERIVSIFQPTHPWNQQRLYMWDAGLRMFRDHPWTGMGLQDMAPAYLKYRSPLATEKVGHLHNVFVQVAASMGVVGLAAFAWLYAALLRTAGAGLRATLREGTLAAGVRLGVTGALVGFLVAGLFEWNFGDEELLYLLFTLVGIAWAARAWKEQP